MQKALGGYAIFVAVAVGIHFVVTPLYHAGHGEFVLWHYFNWFMAPAVLTALGAAWCWKFHCGSSGEAGRDIELLFWGAVVLALLFFWNWFASLMDRGMRPMWQFIDPLLVIVAGAAGLRLWRGADSPA